jgi:flagellar transcriptional activator FlhD
MNTAEMYREIKDLNLSYLMLAQQMLRDDKAGAMFRLGLGEEIASIIGRLTPGQLLKMAATDMLLCRFRFDDSLILELLSNHQRDLGTAHLHAAILAAGKPIEALA